MQTKSVPPKLFEIFGDKNLIPYDQSFNTLFGLIRGGQQVEGTMTVNPANGIAINTDYKDLTIRVVGDGGPVVISAIPQIGYGQDNQHLTLEGTDDSNTVTISTGNGVKTAGGAAFTLKQHYTLVLYFNKKDKVWIEKSRSANA